MQNPTQSPGPGFAVLYRWKLKPGHEAAFISAWTRISQLLRDERGSFGSRLHQSAEGIWYSYAQWPSAEARDQAFALPAVDAVAAQQMKDAILESFPEIVLQPVSDLMVAIPAREA